MTLKLENGIYALLESGLPKEADPLTEILQNAAMRLIMRYGSFAYDRELGSELYTLPLEEEHAEERAVALAQKALMPMAGVAVKAAKISDEGEIEFAISTPLGEGRIIYGELRENT